MQCGMKIVCQVGFIYKIMKGCMVNKTLKKQKVVSRVRINHSVFVFWVRRYKRKHNL